MLRGQERDHGARLAVVGVAGEHVGDGAKEARVGVAEHETELGRRLELRIGSARVVERPLDEALDEAWRKGREGRALGACEQHDHGLSVGEAVVEQVARERVIRRARLQLAHVFGRAQRAHAGASAARELLHQLRRHRRLEQLLLARKVLVEIADRRARPLRHGGHRGGGVAQLRERVRRSRDERLSHVVFRHLHHSKANLAFSFVDRKGEAPRSAGRRGWADTPSGLSDTSPGTGWRWFSAVFSWHVAC